MNDEPVRTYVPLLMRPCIMQACDSTASCHLDTTRTFRVLERFYWWIGKSVYTRWWLRHCLNCQARKIRRLTVRWPIISMPLLQGPGIAISVDYFRPLPVTPRGNTYILLITDRFGRRADMFAVTAAPLRAQSTFWSINTFPYGGAHAPYSRTTASSSSPKAVYQLLGCLLYTSPSPRD